MKKMYLYTVYVESYGEQEVFSNVKAYTAAEAKEKAKKLFIKEYWKRSLLKASIVDKS